MPPIKHGLAHSAIVNDLLLDCLIGVFTTVLFFKFLGETRASKYNDGLWKFRRGPASARLSYPTPGDCGAGEPGGCGHLVISVDPQPQDSPIQGDCGQPVGCGHLVISMDPQPQDSLIPGGCGEPGGCGHLVINMDPQPQYSLIPGDCGEPGGCGHLVINMDPQPQYSLIPGDCGEPGGCGHISAEPPAGGPHGQEQLEHGALLPLHEGGQVRPEPLHV